MISQIVDPPEQLRDAAQELAEKVAKNSPAAMRATKKALWGAVEMGLTRRVPFAGAQQMLVGCGATPTRKKARSRSRRSASARWMDGDHMTFSTYDTSCWSATVRWAG